MSDITETYSSENLRNIQSLALILSGDGTSVDLDRYIVPGCQIIVKSSDTQIPTGIIGSRDGTNIMLLNLPTYRRARKIWIGTQTWGIEVDGAQSDFNINIPSFNFGDTEEPIKIEPTIKGSPLNAAHITITRWNGAVDFSHTTLKTVLLDGQDYDPFIYDKSYRMATLSENLGGQDEASRRMREFAFQALEAEHIINPDISSPEGAVPSAEKLRLVGQHIDRLVGIMTLPNAHVFEGNASVYLDRSNKAQGLTIQSNTLSSTGARCIIDSVYALREKRTIARPLMYNSLLPELNAGVISLDTYRRRLAGISDTEAKNIQASYEGIRDKLGQEDIYMSASGELLIPPAVLATAREYYVGNLGNSLFLFTFPDENGGVLFFLSITTNRHDMWRRIREVIEAA